MHRPSANGSQRPSEETAVSVIAEPWSGGMGGWLSRFPQLQISANRSAQLESFVQIWTALGDNWFMEFIDGRAHAGGPHVFDHTSNERMNDNPGGWASGDLTYQNQEKKYIEFSMENAWGWESRWSIDKLASVNAFHRVVNCSLPSCLDMFDYMNQGPRETGWRFDGDFDTMDRTKPRWSWDKIAVLKEILTEYYDGVDSIQETLSDGKDGTRIHKALPFIAKLYYRLAVLHPFYDGNSRTRNLVLQTELVRQGGHPTVLWDNYWGVVGAKSWNEVYEYVLDGWCSWEIAYKTGDSPFLPFVVTNGSLFSTPHADYNSQTGACERGPPRNYWEPPWSLTF